MALNHRKNREIMNKKAQVGSTITWIVATIAIIVILGVSIFIADIALGNSKEVESLEKTDILASKSFFSYLLTEDTYNQIKIDQGLNETTGGLAIRVFEDLFLDDYPLDVWLGTTTVRTRFSGEDNVYFGERPRLTREMKTSTHLFTHILESIKLNEERTLELVLVSDEKAI